MMVSLGENRVMKRSLLLVAALAGMVAIAALAEGKKSRLLLLDWAAKAKVEKPPVAVLIELGLKDQETKPWPGQATVSGAKVAHREGFRFRGDDKLVDPNGWSVSTHRTAGARRRNAAVNRPNRPVSVGVVLQVTDVQPDAALTLELKDQAKETVPLKDLLGGQNKLLKDGAVSVRLISTATPVVLERTEDDFPAAAYGPDGTLWLAYIRYTLKDPTQRANSPQLPKQPDNFRSYYKPEFGDQLFVKAYRNGQWGDAIPMTGGQEDLVRCGIAVEGNGTVWAAYSANRKGNYDVYVRPISADGKPGTEKALTQAASPDLGPVLCTDQSGNIWLGCQSWDDGGEAKIGLFQCQNGQWRKTDFSADFSLTLPNLRFNAWSPAIAAGPDGQVAVACDIYAHGDYDIFVATVKGDATSVTPVAVSPKFEARPSIAYDGTGRLWIAYEEGPEGWG
jgi:hypothetical protein